MEVGMALETRRFIPTADEYQLLAQVWSAAFPATPNNLEEVRKYDATRQPEAYFDRWWLLYLGQVVGWAEWVTPLNHAAPGKYALEWVLHPDQAALEAAFWQQILDRKPPQTVRVLVKAREDWPRRLFYLQQGFAEEYRMWTSVLDLETFDPTPLVRPLPEGLAVYTLAELDYHLPQVQYQHYQMITTLLRDIPTPTPIEPWPFEVWQARVAADPQLMQSGHFLAFDTRLPNDYTPGRMVGVSELWGSPRPGALRNGLAGVLPEYRRQGLATFLKLQAIDYARVRGYRQLITSNHSANRPMLSINEQLGYHKEPAWIHFLGQI